MALGLAFFCSESLPGYQGCLDRQKKNVALFPLKHLPIFTFLQSRKVCQQMSSSSNQLDKRQLTWLCNYILIRFWYFKYITSVQTVCPWPSPPRLQGYELCPLCHDMTHRNPQRWLKPQDLACSWHHRLKVQSIINWKPLRCSFFHVLKTWKSNKNWIFLAECIYKWLYRSFCDFFTLTSSFPLQAALERTDLKATTAADFKVSSRELPRELPWQDFWGHGSFTPNSKFIPL